MKSPRFQFRSRSLLLMVAFAAAASWAWVATHPDPAKNWHRSIRSDDESHARWEAASRAIDGRVPGIDRATAIAAFCSALADPSWRVRETAAANLWSARGPEAKPTIIALIRAMDDPEAMVRLRSIESIGSIGTHEADLRELAVPALARALGDRNADIRVTAGFDLTMMGRGDLAVPVMEAAIREGRGTTSVALLGLGISGSRERAAVEALKIAAKGSRSDLVKKAATDALGRLPPPVLQPELLGRVDGGDRCLVCS